MRDRSGPFILCLERYVLGFLLALSPGSFFCLLKLIDHSFILVAHILVFHTSTLEHDRFPHI